MIIGLDKLEADIAESGFFDWCGIKVPHRFALEIRDRLGIRGIAQNLLYLFASSVVNVKDFYRLA
jgi:hypothetical protein